MLCDNFNAIDKSAKDALYKDDQLLPDQKTYFEGDEWNNDFSESKGALLMNLKTNYLFNLNTYMILCTCIILLERILFDMCFCNVF